jgi:hypothetical protein
LYPLNRPGNRSKEENSRQTQPTPRIAERNAEISHSPEQFWEAARIAYKQASKAAKFSGQAQKMLAYSEKSLSMARNIDKPGRILSGLNDVIWAHRYVKNFRRVDQSLEEGFTSFGRCRFKPAVDIIGMAFFPDIWVIRMSVAAIMMRLSSLCRFPLDILEITYRRFEETQAKVN